MLFPLQPKPTEKPRVVITGAGIVTALGLGWQTNAQAFRQGRTAFRKVSQFDISRQRVKVAAEVDLPGTVPTTGLTPRENRRLDRGARMLLLAAFEAWQEAQLKRGTMAPLVLGTTSGGMSMGEAYYRQAIEPEPSRRQQATRVLQYQAHLQGAQVSRALGSTGGVTIIGNACASGGNAIGHAYSLIRAGSTEQVLAGGYDALSQLVFSGFDSLLALSPTQCRPFDMHRDGLALGEGAAVMALESLISAERRGAKILGEIVGYGATTDSHHLTQPHPQGEAALEAMTIACRSANVTPGQIGYLNAHGTGTLLNDNAEAQAINRWAGETAATLMVSSTKASIGHTLGAAGAVEAVVCLMALRGQWLPPSIALRQPDPICQFPLVREPATAKLEYALSNSFGFGGANASLILRRWTK